MTPLTLVCWTCGRQKSIETPGHPELAIQLVSWAINAGWLGQIDLSHSRGLVFCSGECKDAARKKDGSFRVYSPKVKLTCDECGARERLTGARGPRGGHVCHECEDGTLIFVPEDPP